MISNKPGNKSYRASNLFFEIYDSDPEDMIALKLKTKSDFEEGLNLYYAKEFAEATVCFKKNKRITREGR